MDTQNVYIIHYFDYSGKKRDFEKNQICCFLIKADSSIEKHLKLQNSMFGNWRSTNLHINKNIIGSLKCLSVDNHILTALIFNLWQNEELRGTILKKEYGIIFGCQNNQ